MSSNSPSRIGVFLATQENRLQAFSARLGFLPKEIFLITKRAIEKLKSDESFERSLQLHYWGLARESKPFDNQSPTLF